MEFLLAFLVSASVSTLLLAAASAAMRVILRCLRALNLLTASNCVSGVFNLAVAFFSSGLKIGIFVSLRRVYNI